MSLRVAMLSVHTCPLAALGGKETGGMNVYVRELSRELGRMGVAVDIFTRSQDPAIPREVAFADRVRVVHVPAGPQAPMPREAVYEHLPAFTEAVEGWRRAAGLAYDLIHAHYWLSGAVALALRERWGVPVLQMFHTLGRLKNEAARNGADREPDVRLRSEARIVAGADRIVAANAVERADLVRHYGAAASRIRVIPCGVDTTLFAPLPQAEARRCLGLEPGPLLLYVGRIAPIKGLDTLLEAVRRLRLAGRTVRLLVVGGEADEPRDGHEAGVRALAARLGLAEAVTFVGPQPQEALRCWYAAADLTVLPSYYESFGMVALEAMACGTPVIASRVGGLPTTIRDGLTGLLVRDGDAGALAARIARVLDDPGLRRTLGREGVRWAAQHRWPCVAEAVGRVYADLVPAAGRHLAAARCG
jgi:D-inositol-3-phosphate glycosyltransferase